MPGPEVIPADRTQMLTVPTRLPKWCDSFSIADSDQPPAKFFGPELGVPYPLVQLWDLTAPRVAGRPAGFALRRLDGENCSGFLDTKAKVRPLLERRGV